MKFSQREIQELVKAWLAISLAFAMLLRGSIGIGSAFLISALTVGIGFILHELAHKFVAQYYKCWAEFRADDRMLVFAIISSFLGFIFAAPGAVYIHGRISKRQNGIISAAGPITNIVLSLTFYFLAFSTSLGGLALYGAVINSWLALFNMIPFGNLDGSKVLAWSKPAFAIIISLAFASYIIL